MENMENKITKIEESLLNAYNLLTHFDWEHPNERLLFALANLPNLLTCQDVLLTHMRRVAAEQPSQVTAGFFSRVSGIISSVWGTPAPAPQTRSLTERIEDCRDRMITVRLLLDRLDSRRIGILSTFINTGQLQQASNTLYDLVEPVRPTDIDLTDDRPASGSDAGRVDTPSVPPARKQISKKQGGAITGQKGRQRRVAAAKDVIVID